MNTIASIETEAHAAGDEQKGKKMKSWNESNKLHSYSSTRRRMVLCVKKSGRCGGESHRSSDKLGDCGKQKCHVCNLGRVVQEGGGAFRKKRSEGKESTYN